MDNVITVRQVCEFMRTAQNRSGIIFKPILARDVPDEPDNLGTEVNPDTVVGYYIPHDFRWREE